MPFFKLKKEEDFLSEWVSWSNPSIPKLISTKCLEIYKWIMHPIYWPLYIISFHWSLRVAFSLLTFITETKIHGNEGLHTREHIHALDTIVSILMIQTLSWLVHGNETAWLFHIKIRASSIRDSNIDTLILKLLFIHILITYQLIIHWFNKTSTFYRSHTYTIYYFEQHHYQSITKDRVNNSHL